MGSFTKKLAVMIPAASSVVSITVLSLLGPHSAASFCSPDACPGQGNGWTCSNSDAGNCMDFCNTDKEDNTSELTSPNLPSNYPNLQNISNTIEVAMRDKIEIHFTYF